jgi:hypothetical protein
MHFGEERGRRPSAPPKRNVVPRCRPKVQKNQARFTIFVVDWWEALTDAGEKGRWRAFLSIFFYGRIDKERWE